ncbi:uncharacterized protein LOC141617483 [Silene latifolia]|uniref:uncharacterized protein LOC141617483 n=1 Tax=Silene latifolia TaxID=37657 RepID=UPI003D786AA7
MSFDGSFTSNGSGSGSGAGVVIVSPTRNKWKYVVTLLGSGTNNKVEYDALLVGLEKLIDLRALSIRILGDSQLVINQVNVVNQLAQFASSYNVEDIDASTEVECSNRHFLVNNDIFKIEVYKVDIMEKPLDWRTDIISVLNSPSQKGLNPKLRKSAFGYLLLDDVLYKKDQQGVLLKCLGAVDALLMMAEVHEAVCGAHQSGPKM